MIAKYSAAADAAAGMAFAACVLLLCWALSQGYAQVVGIPLFEKWWMSWVAPLLSYAAWQAYFKWDADRYPRNSAWPLFMYSLALIMPVFLYWLGWDENFRTLGFLPTVAGFYMQIGPDEKYSFVRLPGSRIRS